MSVENTVEELKQMTTALKEFEENYHDVKTRESRNNAIRKLTDSIKTFKNTVKESFIKDSQIFLVKTPSDFESNKDELSKYGFTADLLSLSEQCSERCVKANTYKNGVSEGYQMSSLVSLLSQEIRDALVGIGINGQDVPKVLGLKAATTPVSRQELTLATYNVFKQTSKSEQKNFEDFNFLYSIKNLDSWLEKQDSFNSKNKILLVVSPEVDTNLVQYLQRKAGKAINVLQAETVRNVLDNIKKTLKIVSAEISQKEEG